MAYETTSTNLDVILLSIRIFIITEIYIHFAVTLSAAGPVARIPIQPNPDAIDIDLGDDNGADEVQSSEVTAATQRADHFELHELDYDNDGSPFHC